MDQFKELVSQKEIKQITNEKETLSIVSDIYSKISISVVHIRVLLILNGFVSSSHFIKSVNSLVSIIEENDLNDQKLGNDLKNLLLESKSLVICYKMNEYLTQQLMKLLNLQDETIESLLMINTSQLNDQKITKMKTTQKEIKQTKQKKDQKEIHKGEEKEEKTILEIVNEHKEKTNQNPKSKLRAIFRLLNIFVSQTDRRIVSGEKILLVCIYLLKQKEYLNDSTMIVLILKLVSKVIKFLPLNLLLSSKMSLILKDLILYNKSIYGVVEHAMECLITITVLGEQKKQEKNQPLKTQRGFAYNQNNSNELGSFVSNFISYLQNYLKNLKLSTIKRSKNRNNRLAKTNNLKNPAMLIKVIRSLVVCSIYISNYHKLYITTNQVNTKEKPLMRNPKTLISLLLKYLNQNINDNLSFSAFYEIDKIMKKNKNYFVQLKEKLFSFVLLKNSKIKFLILTKVIDDYLFQNFSQNILQHDYFGYYLDLLLHFLNDHDYKIRFNSLKLINKLLNKDLKIETKIKLLENSFPLLFDPCLPSRAHIGTRIQTRSQSQPKLQLHNKNKNKNKDKNKGKIKDKDNDNILKNDIILNQILKNLNDNDIDYNVQNLINGVYQALFFIEKHQIDFQMDKFNYLLNCLRKNGQIDLFFRKLINLLDFDLLKISQIKLILLIFSQIEYNSKNEILSIIYYLYKIIFDSKNDFNANYQILFSDKKNKKKKKKRKKNKSKLSPLKKEIWFQQLNHFYGIIYVLQFVQYIKKIYNISDHFCKIFNPLDPNSQFKKKLKFKSKLKQKILKKELKLLIFKPKNLSYKKTFHYYDKLIMNICKEQSIINSKKRKKKQH
ncbi:DNA-directed RNA polymerase i subunit rpa34 [Anaeramoeba flamelloides]|uniref:DNA-directed RNA polymerase i subunit rpa34 n=1 Tax=Anaeramoeba flamelloides TaxID=1746091 RepID=A0ABQ8YEU7_9EUKA|nr:DNA-directed RNA polymerase i subunit rpa34 [Anaeramoeba flamelloides]